MASSFNPFRLIHTSHPSRHDVLRARAQGIEFRTNRTQQPTYHNPTTRNRKRVSCDHDWRSNSFASWRSLRKSGVTSCVLLSARHASTVSCVMWCTSTLTFKDRVRVQRRSQSEREQEVNYRTIRIINSYSTCTLIPTRLQLYTSCTDCVFSSLLTCCRVSLISLSLPPSLSPSLSPSPALWPRGHNSRCVSGWAGHDLSPSTGQEPHDLSPSSPQPLAGWEPVVTRRAERPRSHWM